MLKPVYLFQGETLLAQNTSLESLLTHKGRLMSTPFESADLINHSIFISTLADENLKDVGAERMVRKTSERQARWLIASGVRTWRTYFNEPQNKAGLFIGLGTVDCDEEDNPELVQEPTAECLATAMLEERRPLVCLALLNSSATSHIAQLAGITGENMSFSPLLSAGLNALCEGYFAIAEGRLKHALCGGGSQKITPWSLLAYESIWANQDNYWLSEAASFFIASDEPRLNQHAAIGVMRQAYRARLQNNAHALTEQVNRITGSPLIENQHVVKVILVGANLEQQDITLHALGDELKSRAVVLDSYVGNTMAAATAIACNSALSYLHDAEQGFVIVIAFGDHAEFGMFLIEANND
ncbi:hypothetical protein EXT42_07765 [Pseudoalteromonas sp. CO302Y]|uniref:beta-ketoacyl synthase N-terminal-like domain-containing protein n=1 Tax=unclassified Pseudoalteromonas TaxID=194690 RepID=UPI001022AF9C|nr:hypothetical protein EXT42_07765 [Pseudoalteromonas sp. CO302Y]RZG09765.1 hypothetical protein EXT40_07775 [Pseudoalteromonas sp. CO133X]